MAPWPSPGNAYDQNIREWTKFKEQEADADDVWSIFSDTAQQIEVHCDAHETYRETLHRERSLLVETTAFWQETEKRNTEYTFCS